MTNHRRLTCFQPDTFSFGGQDGNRRTPAAWRGSREPVCTEEPDLVLGYWGGNVQTPVCKRTPHPDFPPKLATNSVFKPQTGCILLCMRVPPDLDFPPKIFETSQCSAADTNYTALCRSVKRQGHFDVSWKRRGLCMNFGRRVRPLHCTCM